MRHCKRHVQSYIFTFSVLPFPLFPFLVISLCATCATRKQWFCANAQIKNLRFRPRPFGRSAKNKCWWSDKHRQKSKFTCERIEWIHFGSLWLEFNWKPFVDVPVGNSESNNQLDNGRISKENGKHTHGMWLSLSLFFSLLSQDTIFMGSRPTCTYSVCRSLRVVVKHVLVSLNNLFPLLRYGNGAHAIPLVVVFVVDDAQAPCVSPSCVIPMKWRFRDFYFYCATVDWNARLEC